MTETTGSTATPESGNSAAGVNDAVPADAEENLSRRDRKRANRAAGGDGAKGGKRAKKSVFARAALFYRQIIAELRKVVWPTRSELVQYSSVVVTFVVVIMAIVAGMDYGLSKLSLLIFG
ncbi:preprotein translocase subunit SecE [Kitasatospora sp. MMS16-BH015]|uniref:preprotein translocase subunit SecE n=1 Tax=Kitasatospora sp. MMS16-BH015 TaxID=2018025 RepID=UPI000CA22FD9|nr:preprotein translocase subunit SecE [Kitasatospora sp. MMS16-BH015]AUG77807.1 preprotein translocase subunit SecE [Kitasatospora sp. MMS16-BH015]